jgi:hypothetical protein
MYEHRYGKGVDFSGYIDKFYSTNIFSYDNRKYVRNKLKEIFQQKTQNIPDGHSGKFGPDIKNQFYAGFEYILSSLFAIDVITLRNLDQFSNYDFPSFTIIAGPKEYQFEAEEFPFLILIHLLKKIVDIKLLKEHLSTLANIHSSNPDFVKSVYYDKEIVEKSLIRICLEFIVAPDKIFNNDSVSEGGETGSTFVNNRILNYELFLNFDSGIRTVRLIDVTSQTNPPVVVKRPNVFDFLLDALLKSEAFVVVD